MQKIAKLVSKFICGACQVYPAELFGYSPNEPLITFCLDETTEDNRIWKEYLQENFNFKLTAENVFLMSILHELGHHATFPNFTTEEWIEQASEKSLQEKNYPTEKDYFVAYYNLPIEIAATTWAIKMYNEHRPYMRAWCQRFNCAIRHYEKKHKIKNSLLTRL